MAGKIGQKDGAQAFHCLYAVSCVYSFYIYLSLKTNYEMLSLVEITY